jgi:hypothetical protein
LGKADRKRWDGNVRSMAIIAKDRADITDEDVTFLRENYTSAGGLLPNAYSGGAFFTPTHVAKFIWDVLKPRIGDSPRVLEPSVGSGVFLEHAPSDAEITALELDETSAKVTSLLCPNTDVILGDALVHDRRDYYDLVIGNPPYGVSVNFESDDEWASISKKKGAYGGKSEVAFIELAIKTVKPGGYIAYVLPMGVSFANYAAKLRQLMYETCWQVATIHLPGETFAHVGTTISTQILILRKVPPNTERYKVEKRMLGNRGNQLEFNAEFFAGQMPAYFARVADIGYDKDGKPTDKWGDGLTQLDELFDDLADVEYELVRSNLYPNIPSWSKRKGENSEFYFDRTNGDSDGSNKASQYDGPHRWNEFTLGMGDEYEWRGKEVSSMDYSWQEEIVAEWRRSLSEASV